MLTTILAAAVVIGIAALAWRKQRARIARVRRLYDPVFHARRMALGTATGAVFRRPAL